jgi:DNA (cytosine-5)-methyltransferase 1
VNKGRSQPRMACLFAGGGGLFLGFKQAGFKAVFATDIEATAAETFALNNQDVRFHLGDVRHLTSSIIDELAGGEAIDIIVGGPPCQGFSTLGDQIQGDARNSLFEAFARVIRWIQPKCILIENTSYLRTQYGGWYENEIRATLESLGYSVHVETLNAADFGTPQIRRRLFFFGTKLDSDFSWPLPTHGPVQVQHLLPYKTVGETIMDIADVSASSSLHNHIALNHSEKVIARYKLIPEGGRLPAPQLLPEEIRRRNFGNTYKRLHSERPSLTLVPGNNAFPIHPTEHRSLTPREAARLQGFPDAYIFAGSRSEQCKLIGNAVPVQLAKELGTAIRRHLKQRKAKVRLFNIPKGNGYQLELQIDVKPACNVPRKRNGKHLTAASFFTGAGGLLLGFVKANYNILASFDRKSIVAKNMNLNFPWLRHYHADLSQMSIDEIREAVGRQSPDVVFGGPPCQGFSIFGNRRFINTRGHRPDADLRNELTLRFIDIALALSPKVIFLENVKGLLSTPRGDSLYIDEIVHRLGEKGYAVEYRVVNCAAHGIPQLRERLILVATSSEIEFHWPSPKYFENPKPWQRPYNTVNDAIIDLMDPATHDKDYSHVPMNHKELVVERYKLIPEGGKLPEKDLPDHLREGYRSKNIKNYSHVYRRLDGNQPASTLVPGHNAFPVHPKLPRTLTVREAARLQTFPDSMRFTGTRQQQCLLVGNAVPPLLAEIFAQAIAKAIRGNIKLPGYKADHYELRLEA